MTAYGYPAVNDSGVGQPHTLTSVTVGGGTAKSYTYDEQGNTTKRYGPTGTAQSLTWDIEGELARLTEDTKTTDYLYDANGELLIRRGTDKTVLYLTGQELHYDAAAKKFTAQRYYPAGDATAVRTETGLTWMVDDHHGTASMAVNANTQAVTRRYTKPFGEDRGTTPPAWPDDKGFLGKPADAGTGLTHIGAREYDPTTGRFLSVDPILAPQDHESLNGYAYANNTPVTKSDPTGLRPITDCENGCSDGNGGFYRDYMSPGPNGGWIYNTTQTYTESFQYQKKGGGVGSGTMTVTVHTKAGHTSAQIVFKRGPDPKPSRRDGSQCRSCWAQGTNPYYDAKANDLPDKGKLATWQKLVVGAIAAVAVAVVAAPVAVAVGEGCLATAPVCAANLLEIASGGASGGSAIVGGGAAAGATAKGVVNLTAAGDDFGIWASKANAKAGYTDVIIHGAKHDFGPTVDAWKKGTNFSFRALARLVRQHPNYNGGSVRLISCETGGCDATAAQNLANALQVKVMAPTDIVWAKPNGVLRVSPKPYGKTGEWKVFEPMSGGGVGP